LLPARIAGYHPGLLDELCLSGDVGWGRLFPPKRDPHRSRPMASLTRVAPISLFLRSDLDWLSARSPMTETDSLSSPAAHVYELLQQRGAMFAADLINETQMVAVQMDDVLGELVSRGLVTADGFGGLRQLIKEKRRSSNRTGRRLRPGLLRNRKANSGTGRWSLWRNSETVSEMGGRGSCRAEVDANNLEQPLNNKIIFTEGADVEQWAWQLLRRWGVVFRDVMIRESGAPRWFDLLQRYRRMEARGEIRGGRFIAGVAGEQFALGETVRKLRQLRDETPDQELIILSAADTLNLVGIVTDHQRIRGTAANRVAYLDGVPVAALQSGEIQILGPIPEELQAVVTSRLGTTPQKALSHITASV
ncbi:MAG: DEAD/DEAH box helicase, partial [Planctomycetes bacterium]|nr:DEAD/DEAH box helicase [Planctomycetota bacterium]